MEMTGTSTIRRAGAQALRGWLRYLLASPHQTAGECEQQVTVFLDYARAMGLDLSRLWVREPERGGGVRTGAGAAVLCIPSAGRSAMLVLPDGRVHPPRGDEWVSLVGRAMADPTVSDVRLFQALLAEGDEPGRRELERAGFGEIATLIYMERAVGLAAPAARRLDHAMRWVTYDETVRELFGATILATYEGSLDCPGLAGLRELDDVLASHRGAGRFAAHRWLLLLKGEEPAGCILLAEHPLQPVLEIAYMGVTPRFRGRGLGSQLLAEAFGLAHREQFQRVTLAADARNAPALRMYGRAGFTEFLRRRAMLHCRVSNSISQRRYDP